MNSGRQTDKPRSTELKSLLREVEGPVWRPVTIYFYFYLFILLLINEFTFYLLGSIKINKKIYIYDFIRWFFIQIPYIVSIGILSPLAPYLGWKSNPS